MASVEKRPHADGRPRYLVRWRGPDGAQRSKTFTRKIDADRHAVAVESSKLVGAYVDPRASGITVDQWADRWLAGKTNLAPSTKATTATLLDTHVRPRFGPVKLADLRREDLQAWIAGIDRKPATVRRIHQVVSPLLGAAVKSGRLAVNPAAGLDLPRVRRPDKRYLTHAQVDALAEACGPDWSLMVRLLAYTGLRWGEMAALTVKRVDLLRRRVTVAESVTPVRGRLVWGDTKSHERREVPIPKFLAADLEALMSWRDGPDDQLFTGPLGGVPRSRTLQRSALTAAAKAIGAPGLTPHELRHTAASLAIASGADVKVVQRMLGHKSATMTLDLYGHLFPDRLDQVADAMTAARELEMTRPTVVELRR
ncbi:MAG: site-specific integrase [Propionibacteriaceae bacterium]|jgi:integrase|nr:site-specific integrase [Propionibacteriaceae bacterium]